MKVISIFIDAETKKRMYRRNEVAQEVGVTTQTIRLWEDAKVIPQSVRDENNYRYWSEKDLEKIKAYASTSRKERYGNVAGKQ